MDRGRARFSYSTYEEHHRRRPPAAFEEEETRPCSLKKRDNGCPCSAQSPAPAPAQAQALNSLDFKQLLLFAGVGILFVVAADAIVRIATHHRPAPSGGSITIDGRTYVPAP